QVDLPQTGYFLARRGGLARHPDGAEPRWHPPAEDLSGAAHGPSAPTRGRARECGLVIAAAVRLQHQGEPPLPSWRSHASAHNHFNRERRLSDRPIYKASRTTTT